MGHRIIREKEKKVVGIGRVLKHNQEMSECVFLSLDYYFPCMEANGREN